MGLAQGHVHLTGDRTRDPSFQIVDAYHSATQDSLGDSSMPATNSAHTLIHVQHNNMVVSMKCLKKESSFLDIRNIMSIGSISGQVIWLVIVLMSMRGKIQITLIQSTFTPEQNVNKYNSRRVVRYIVDLFSCPCEVKSKLQSFRVDSRPNKM